ncbi:MAG: radical SAM protein [Dehalococcoidia bacterium]|nr:radical SAM protein [Dehalococcoidia bacterium]
MNLDYRINTDKLADYSFELGPIRPPSEAYSLLIRVTRNCPWNRCQFCPVYKGQKFELRPAEDVIRDIETAKAIADEIKELARRMGDGGRLRDVAAAIYNGYQHNASIRNVALWLWAGGKSAFLQDANTLIMRTPDLVRVISFLKQSFPELNRITSYARSKTAAKKSLEELKELKDAGLSRLHIGMESGSNLVLSYMEKGVTAEEHIAGGKKVKGAGISLCEYVMPGLGGRKMSSDHVIGTAAVLNETDPDYIRLRTLYVRQDMPLWSKLEAGDFELQTEDEVVEEIGKLIEKLEATSELKSDHILNLLPEVEGKFPEAKPACLATINRYLALPPEERLNFRLGRRTGYYEKLDDLYDANRHQKVDEAIKHITSETTDSVDETIYRIKSGFM